MDSLLFRGLAPHGVAGRRPRESGLQGAVGRTHSHILYMSYLVYSATLEYI